MATDLSEANGWIPEPSSNEVLTKSLDASAVEQYARKVRMTAPTLSVPRFESEGVDIVAEHGTIPVQDATLDEVVLRAVKWADRFAISVEDQRDAVVDVLNAKKAAWIASFNRELDNACLGTTVAKNGTTVPFYSVYYTTVWQLPVRFPMKTL
jgi:HK97 family phage major capsid protein